MDVVFLYDRPDVPSNRKATRNISGRNAGNRRISVPGRLLEVEPPRSRICVYPARCGLCNFALRLPTGTLDDDTSVPRVPAGVGERLWV